MGRMKQKGNKEEGIDTDNGVCVCMCVHTKKDKAKLQEQKYRGKLYYILGKEEVKTLY